MYPLNQSAMALVVYMECVLDEGLRDIPTVPLRNEPDVEGIISSHSTNACDPGLNLQHNQLLHDPPASVELSCRVMRLMVTADAAVVPRIAMGQGREFWRQSGLTNIRQKGTDLVQHDYSLSFWWRKGEKVYDVEAYSLTPPGRSHLAGNWIQQRIGEQEESR